MEIMEHVQYCTNGTISFLFKLLDMPVYKILSTELFLSFSFSDLCKVIPVHLNYSVIIFYYFFFSNLAVPCKISKIANFHFFCP